MGKMSRDKGQRIERALVHLHQAAGLDASRVPLSGAAGGAYSGDLRRGDLGVEVKARASGSGFKQREAWLGECAMLFLKRDRQRPLVVMPWATYEKLMTAYQESRHTA